MIFAACSSEDEEKYTTIDENSLEFDSNGGSQTISISSNTNWYIDDNPFEWITVSSSKEGSGNAQVTISVATGIYHGSFKSVVPQNITVYWEHIKLKPFYFHDRYMLVIISVIKASRKPLSSFQRILLRNSLSDHTSRSCS